MILRLMTRGVGHRRGDNEIIVKVLPPAVYRLHAIVVVVVADG